MPKYIQFTVIEKEKQKIMTFENLEPMNLCHSCLKNYWNNKLFADQLTDLLTASFDSSSVWHYWQSKRLMTWRYRKKACGNRLKRGSQIRMRRCLDSVCNLAEPEVTLTLKYKSFSSTLGSLGLWRTIPIYLKAPLLHSNLCRNTGSSIFWKINFLIYSTGSRRDLWFSSKESILWFAWTPKIWHTAYHYG